MKDPNEEALHAHMNSLHSLTGTPLLDPAFRKRKLILWSVRQAITIILAVIFWEHWWVRWLFALAVVLALINLAMLLFAGPYLQRRMDKVLERRREQEAIWDAEDRLMEMNEDKDPHER